MLHVSETWPLPKTNLQRLQRNDRVMIRQICSIKPEDVATVRSSELLAKLELEDLDLFLREKRLHWFGHVERSSGEIRTSCDIQIDGRRGAGRPRLTWKKLTERDCRELKLTKVDPQERSTWRSGERSATRAASQLPGKSPLMWMMPLHLHVNPKSDFDMMIYYLILITVRLPGIFVLKVTLKTWKKIQERALRFVYDDFKSTYEELLNKANIPFLHIKKIRTMAVETFRILNDMSPPALSDLVRIRDCSSYNFSYQNVLQVPQVRTTKYGKKSFRFAAAVLWNSFPDNFRQVSSFNQFKALISYWSGKDCKCNLCR